MSDKSNILATLLGRPPSSMNKANSTQSETTNDRLGSSRATSAGAGPQPGKQHKLRQRFNVIRKLGKGAYGKVQLAINKETGQEVAIKTIKKTKIENELDMERVRREIQIMSSIEHPHIVHIYEVFENKDKIVLVMQYAPGGELYEYVSEAKCLDEAEARRLFRQIATAIYYCHQNKICHRDLKLENILLDEKNNAKLADFGLSNVFDKRRQLKTFCGSPLYASPEIVQGSPYEGPEVDCWSLGVLLYTLVYGAMPFDGSNFKRLVKQISESSYFEPKQKSHASPLIKRLLCADPTRRATIVDICSDPWVNGAVGLEQQHNPLLQVAQDMANLTPVRLDILMALAPEIAGEEPALAPAEIAQKKPEPIVAKPPLGRIENLPRKSSRQEAPLEDTATVSIGTYVVRDLDLDRKEQMPPPPPPQPPVEQPEELSVEVECRVEPEVEVLALKTEEEQPKMEVIDAENHLLEEVPAEVEVSQEEEEEQGIPMELDTVVYQEPVVSSPVAVKEETVSEDRKEEEDSKKAAVEEQPSDEEGKENVEPSKGDAVKADDDKAADDKVADDNQATTGATEDKLAAGVDEKPKKAKKKVLVKRKKKVSKKEKEVGEPLENGAASPARPGKIQIPDTFTASAEPAPEALPPRATEARRQSALIADVAQKLFQPASSSQVKQEPLEDLHGLANVRVSDKKSEFERRASSSSAGAPSYSAGEHRRRSSVSRQPPPPPPEPQPGKAELLREPALNQPQTSQVEQAPLRVPSRVEELAVQSGKGSGSLQVPQLEPSNLSDSQETIRPETPSGRVRTQLSIKLGSGRQEQADQETPLSRQPTPTLVPIARSYKKVTFTKDGACVTETGRVISEELPDGTIRRVDRRSKVTHYVSGGPNHHQPPPPAGATFSEEISSQVETDADWDPFGRLVMPSASLLSPHHHHHQQQQQNNHINHHLQQPNESCSSLSSGSTDAFEDIFDTWTGAFQHGLPPSLFGSAGGRHGGRHRLAGSGHRVAGSEASSPRCGSADPTRGCWGLRGAPQRPPVWPGSGYESDAGSRPAKGGSLFGGARPSGSVSGLKSPSSMFGRSQVEELHLSMAEEHERLRQRIARQHRNFWKGSTPSLFSLSESQPPPPPEASRMSPAARPPRPISTSTVQQQQHHHHQVVRTISVKSKTPQEEEQVEQSLSSSSFIRESVALDAAPRRHRPPSDSFTCLVKSSSRASVQSSNASFIGLKKSTSIKQRLQQHQSEVHHHHHEEQHQQRRQLDETNRVQNWLQDSTQVAPSSTLSSGSSGSSFGLSTTTTTTAAAANNNNNSTPVARNYAAAQAAAGESTKATGSASSVSRAESSSRVHRTFQLRSAAAAAEFPAVASAAGAETPTASRKSPLEWLQSSLLEENEELEGELVEPSSLGSRGTSGSLLDQLRSRGYRSMINQRMELHQAEAPGRGVSTKTQSSSTSSTTTSFVLGGASGDSPASTTTTQQHFTTTTTSVTTTASSGSQRLAPEPGTGGGGAAPLQAEACRLPEALVSSNGGGGAGCPAPAENKGSVAESGAEPAESDVIMNAAAQVAQVAAEAEGDKREDEQDVDEEEEDEEEDDEELRQARETVKAHLKRMRDTELFLKSLARDEEQEEARKRSFLFDNMILNARLSSELARANALSVSKTSLWGIDQPATGAPGPARPISSAAPASAPVLLLAAEPAAPPSPFLSSFAAATASLHTAPVLAHHHHNHRRLPTWASLSNPPVEESPAPGVPEFRRSLSQLGAQPSRLSRPSFRRATPGLESAPSYEAHDYLVQTSSVRPRFRSQSQVRSFTGGTSCLVGAAPAADRWRRELSVNPTLGRATSPAPSYLATSANHNELGDDDDDPDTLHQNDVDRFGLAKYRVSAYEPAARSSPAVERRRSLQVSHLEKHASLESRGGGCGDPPAPTSKPEVPSQRRYSTVSEGGGGGGSRLQELEQRILANKKRRDELLLGASEGASSDCGAHRGASPRRLSPAAAAAAAPTGGSGTIFAAQRRSTGKVAEQPIRGPVGSSRPSRLESMEARIKRRSYCVRLADCSPERAPAGSANSRPASLSLEGWKRRGSSATGLMQAPASPKNSAPDRLDARVAALNHQLDDRKWCRAGAGAVGGEGAAGSGSQDD